MKRVRLINRQPMPSVITLLDAISDERLFARWFKDDETWTAWRAFICALFALPMSAEQLVTYRQCTGRDEQPSHAPSEAWLVCGRRAGKSFICALVAVFLAAFFDYRRYLSPGERGVIMVIAADRKQARVILNYVRALLTEVPMLARLIQRETAEAFDLSNRISIEVATASFRSVRGYTIVAALCDELAFWPTDNSVDPDTEIINALRPAMATIPNARLICASSPYARRGALWNAHRRHFGKDGDPILVWQAPTRTMNPTVPQRVIDEAMENDAPSALAEYGAQFRSDIEGFVVREVVEACVDQGVYERAPVPGVEYFAFADPSGGSADSFTLAIGHKADDVSVLDAVREVKPPFSPESVVKEFAALLKSYHVTTVTGDRYAGEWPRERFAVHHIDYEPAAAPKSQLYQALLPTLNSGKLVLLDNERLIPQLIGLERRTARGGRDTIDHAPGGHDDVANAVAGVMAALAEGTSYDETQMWVIDQGPPPEPFAPRNPWNSVRNII